MSQTTVTTLGVAAGVVSALMSYKIMSLILKPVNTSVPTLDELVKKSSTTKSEVVPFDVEKAFEEMYEAHFTEEEQDVIAICEQIIRNADNKYHIEAFCYKLTNLGDQKAQKLTQTILGLDLSDVEKEKINARSDVRTRNYKQAGERLKRLMDRDSNDVQAFTDYLFVLHIYRTSKECHSKSDATAEFNQLFDVVLKRLSAPDACQTFNILECTRKVLLGRAYYYRALVNDNTQDLETCLQYIPYHVRARTRIATNYLATGTRESITLAEKEIIRAIIDGPRYDQSRRIYLTLLQRHPQSVSQTNILALALSYELLRRQAGIQGPSYQPSEQDINAIMSTLTSTNSASSTNVAAPTDASSSIDPALAEQMAQLANSEEFKQQFEQYLSSDEAKQQLSNCNQQ